MQTPVIVTSLSITYTKGDASKMTVQQQSKLSRLYEQLYQQALRLPGTQRLTLPNKARMAITIAGCDVIVSFARHGKPLGDREIITFRSHCAIPEHAQRIPDEGQAIQEGWHVMGYSWRIDREIEL
jgi:hypothetical protein